MELHASLLSGPDHPASFLLLQATSSQFLQDNAVENGVKGSTKAM